MRRIISAREQVEMLSPWLRVAASKPPSVHHWDLDWSQATDDVLPLSTLRGTQYPDSDRPKGKFNPQGMEPIKVLHQDGTHWIMDGHHRVDWAARAGVTELPVRVLHASLVPWRLATPWHSKPGDPTYRVPTQDLQRHRQFNPSIETPEQMHRSLWTKSWDKDTPEYRNFRTDNFSSGGSSEGSTEEGLVEGFESGAKFPPTEITTNGVGAMLTDGNHRVNVADMMSHPDLESYIHYDPHAYGDDSYPSPVDPESELGKHIHKLVQNHPYEPVEGGPTTDHVFRRHPQTGEWQRGHVDHSSQPHFVDTPDDLKQMQRHVPGFKDQGLGTYFDVDFGNGPEITHERHLHARRL